MKRKYLFWKRKFAWLLIMTMLFSSVPDHIMIVKATESNIQQEEKKETEQFYTQKEQDTIPETEQVGTQEEQSTIEEQITVEEKETDITQEENVNTEDKLETTQEIETSVQETESETVKEVETESVSMPETTRDFIQESSSVTDVIFTFVEENKKEVEQSDITYQCFKNGEAVGDVCTSEEEVESLDLLYDGYVKIEKNDTTVTVTPIAKMGYDFVMLSFIDESGNATTPLTKDYKRTSDGDAEESSGNYSYSFTVDENQTTVTIPPLLGTLYSVMPQIKAYFEPEDGLLNQTLLGMEPKDILQQNKDKPNSVTSWLGPIGENSQYGTLHVGTKSDAGVWNGVDSKNGDYVTYYAGEGKIFQITAVSIYSRQKFSKDRFRAVIKGSYDGENFYPILTTKDGSAGEQYSIIRNAIEEEIKYPYIRFESTKENTDISLLKVYGSVVDAGDLLYEEYQCFKNGEVIKTYQSKEELEADVNLDYDGYVKVKMNVTEATVTAVPKDGYRFIMLNFVDEDGNTTTPLTKDYKRTSSGDVTEINSTTDYSYSFIVDEKQTTAIVPPDIGIRYQMMPKIVAYFEPEEGLLNQTLLGMEPSDILQQNKDKPNSVTSWLGPIDENSKYGTLHIGTKSDSGLWNGVDSQKDDYVVYYAGEGKTFEITTIGIYSRRGFSDSRFTALVEGSYDGENYHTILETKKGSGQEKYAIIRNKLDGDIKYPYIRFKATANNTDVSLLKLYGSIEEAGDLVSVEYQCFKDGKVVKTYESEEAMKEDSTLDCEGYAVVTKTGTERKVTVVANDGFEFMILNLKDKNGNITTPLSKDYVKTGDTTNKKTEGIYTYAFEVNDTKETEVGEEKIGTIYKEMPEIEIYFDPKMELINNELLKMEALDSKITNNKPISSWIDTETATLNAGINAWDGMDIAKNDYITYYAGNGNAFCLSGLSIYSRRGFSDTRFTAVIEASNDGDNFVTIFSTENTSTKEQYAIHRTTFSKDLKFRIIRIKAGANSRNMVDVSLLKLYGTVEMVADADLSKLEQYENSTDLPKMTDNIVTINDTITNGFTHPGVGITKEQLENIRTQVRSEKDPWYNYYKNMAVSSYGSRTFSCSNGEIVDGKDIPKNNAYNDKGTKDRAIADGKRAFTQAILYVITGDIVYRENAMRIIRIWEQMDPDAYAYFSDAHIHAGEGLYQMVMAAEILRYTESDLDGEWAWNQDDTEKFIANVIDPSVRTFLDTNEKFMNQHNFPLTGTIAAAIFKSDAEDYAKRVEWTTVNSTAPDPYMTGSIQQVYRWMKKDEESGTALSESDWHVQLIEMGRDLAHAGDDVGTLIRLARMIETQKTKVDPVKGTISNGSNAVDIYAFLDNSILRATDYFCQFDMGYEVNWTPARTSEGSSDDPPTIYTIASDEYRGRLYPVEFAELYYVYIYQLGYSEAELEELAPYYMQAFRQKHGAVYYATSSGEDTDLKEYNTEGAWLYIPEEVATDGNTTAANVPESYSESNKYEWELERQFSIIDGSNQVRYATNTILVESDGNGTSYIQTTATNGDTQFAVYNLSLINRKADASLVGLRIRTNGNAVLEIRKEVDLEPFHILQLPNTHDEWQYVVFDMSYNTVTAGQYPKETHLMYFNVVGEGTEVAFDQINIKAEEALSAPVFDQVTDSVMHLVIAAGDAFSYDFHATDANSIHNANLQYELQGDSLNGGVFDTSTGQFQWNPTKDQAGNYDCYVIVSDGITSTSVNLKILVGTDRLDAIERLCSEIDFEKDYLSVTMEDFNQAKEECLALSDGAFAETYYTAMEKLIQAADALEELNPKLDDGSLNFPIMLYQTSLDVGKAECLIDNNSVTFTGDLTMKYFTMDFGPLYRVKVSSFAIQPRNIWPARMAGCVIMGSNDGETWDKLTVESPYSNYLERLKVKEEYQNNGYRYFKISSLSSDSDSKYAARESILSVGELRIYGIREEIGTTKIREVSISTDATPLTNHIGNSKYTQSYPKRALPGDTITLQITAKQKLEELSVTIAGIEAEVTQTEDLQYTAEVILTEEAAEYNASKYAIFCIRYTYLESGELLTGREVTETTDGTIVLVSSEKDTIELENRYYYSSYNSGEIVRKTQEQIAEQVYNITDHSTITVSDARNPDDSATGSYIIIDFGENRGVSLKRCEVLGRLDYLSRSTGIYLQGSNDFDETTYTGTWNTLTKSSVYTAEWQGLEVLDYRYYRYIRLSNDGNWYGNMAELRLFGTETEDLANAVEKTALKETIEKAEQLEESNYTEESYQAMKEALDYAKEIAVKENTTQEEVDAAEKALKEAMEALLEKSEEPTTPELPSEPEEPPTSESPSDPEEPPTSESPSEPEEPPTSESPSEPEEPPTSESPSEPEEPPTSELPSDPEEPTTPEEIEKPSSPNKPENPEDKEEDRDDEDDFSNIFQGIHTQGTGKIYQKADGSIARNEWILEQNHWYYAGADGMLKTGWLQTPDNKWYYLLEDCTMTTGWKQVNGKWYYLEEKNGDMQEGWKYIEDKWYYLNLVSGDMAVGWKQVNNKWYYLEDKNGNMLEGWKYTSGKWYYLNPISGDMATGWKQVGGKWYYLNPINGDMAVGWKQIGSKWYYLTLQGDCLIDTITPDGYTVNQKGEWVPQIEKK